MTTRDVDQAAVYTAEAMAFEGTDLDATVELTELRERVRLVVAQRWWPGLHVDVVGARLDAGSSCARQRGSDGVVEIRIAGPQSSLMTAAHELAHALAGVPSGHDAVFRRAYVDVVGVLTNLDSTDRRGRLHADHLASAFDAAGLQLGQRRWPDPGLPGRAIPLPPVVGSMTAHNGM